MKHNLLKSVIISVILLMGVSNAWGYNEYNKQYLYFDGSSFTSFFSDGCKPYVSPKWSYDGADGNSNGGDKEMTQIGSTNYYYLDLSQSSGSYKNFRGFYIGRSSSFHNGAHMGVVDGSGNNCIKATDWGVYSWSNYAPPMSSVTLANNGTTILGGSGTSSKPYLIKPGTTIKVKASGTKTVPDPDATIYYDFKQSSTSKQQGTGTTYSFTASSTANTLYTINLDGFTKISSTSSTKKAATALYFKTIATYAVTISTDGNGTVSPSSDQQVGEAPVSITATANSGYSFKNWTTTGGAKVTNTTSATTTITATATGTVKANFEEDLSSNWKLIGDNQNNSPFGDNYTYSSGKAMTKKSGHSTESNVYVTLDIKHLPASYYGFKVATSNNDNDKYGYGQDAGYYITFNRSASNSQKQVYSGSQHELKFIPDALGEYEFRVNYPSDKYVYVTFPTAYAVTFGKGTGGSSVTAQYNSTSFNSGTKVQSGKTVTFTQTASAGYTFKEWNTKSDGTGTKLSTNATYTRTVAATNTVYAIYTKKPDNIVYLKPSHSWKSNNAQFAVKYGDTNHMMTEVEECCEEKYYKVTIPSQYSEFNFVRLSDNGTTEWNVTGEISVPTDGKNLYDMTKIYLKPNGNWKSGNARFAAYFFDSQDKQNKTKWMSMLPTDEDGVFYCDFPTDHIFDYVSLTRMNGAESYNDWAYRWNQTKDIELFQGYNSYELEEDKWGKDNSNPQKDDDMNVIYKCKWTTYNPTYTVTLEPFQYGEYGITFDGKTYKSKPTEEVIIEYVPLGTKIQLIDAVANTPHYGHKLDNNGDRMYESAVVVKHNSTSSTNYHIGAETEFTHTLCGTTTFRPNMVTTAPHRVYLHIPQNLLEGWNKTNSGATINCVYATEYLTNKNDGRPGALVVMTKDTYLSGLDNGDYYYCDIPEGYHYFYFERKITNNDDAPKNSTIRFNYEIPLTNLNCFNLDGTDSSGKYTGEWGVAPASTGDYRLLYVEQVVKKSELLGNEWKTIVERTYTHTSDIIKKRTSEGVDTVSLHIYTRGNHPEVILQQYQEVGNKVQWVDIEAHMVNGPLEADPGMAMLPGRKNASPDSKIDDFVYDDGIEVIKADEHDDGCGVWNFPVEQDGTTATLNLLEGHLKRYTGEYYIRTDNAEGGWEKYTLPGNYMTYSQYAKDHSGFSHYFCKWVEVDNKPNTKFVISNDYGVAISDTLAGDQFTDKDGNIQENANIRWSWNMVNNEIARAYIQGTWKAGSQERNRNLVVNYKPSSEGAVEDLLDDSGDWIYQKDFPVKVGSHLNSLTAQYPVSTGSTQTFASNLDMLTGDPAVNDKDYKVRILYDFKINKTLVALVPNANEASIAIDVVIERINQGEATQVQAPIAYSNNQRSGEGSTVYGVMSFDKSHLTDPSLSSQQKLTYWISFPFDVKLSEIFGFGEVGDYWMIKYYDGKDRAAKGLYDDNTFWKFITNRNYTLKANQGYVLALNKKVMDANSPIFTNTTRISLYFPSKEKLLNINTDYTQTTCTIPEYTCTITSPTDRRTKDSNWNFIGVPSFANKNRNTTNENLKYFYDYDYLTDTYSVAINRNSRENTFKSMFAYMVQFAGTIDWSTLASNGSQGLAAKKTDNVEKHVLRIELQQNNTKVDQTYIQLEDEEVTAMFDMNYDLTKLFNSKTNIYSLIPSDTDPIQVAANVMPIEETIIPLGIKLDAAGEYTFAMPDGTDGIVVELIDYDNNTRTNMLLDEYTVNLGKGTFESRFALHVKPNKTTTSLEDVNTNTTGVKKYLIDGVLYMQKDGVLYDAQGKLVR